MFGFGEATRMRKLRNAVKGLTLTEVIEKYGDGGVTSVPNIRYDAALASKMAEHIKTIDENNVDEWFDRLKGYCAENSLDEAAIFIYLADKSFSSLRFYAIDLAAAEKLVPDSEFADYFFSIWLESIPFITVLPILFPPQNGGRIEEFNISREKRNELIDELFARLKNTESFESLVNSFVSEHPYFRHYPNVG